jgi:hypothetical protein
MDDAAAAAAAAAAASGDAPSGDERKLVRDAAAPPFALTP